MSAIFGHHFKPCRRTLTLIDPTIDEVAFRDSKVPVVAKAICPRQDSWRRAQWERRTPVGAFAQRTVGSRLASLGSIIHPGGLRHAPNPTATQSRDERLHRGLLCLCADLQSVQRQHDRLTRRTGGDDAALHPVVPGMRGHLPAIGGVDEPRIRTLRAHLSALRGRLRSLCGGMRPACPASCSVRPLRARMPALFRSLPAHGDGESCVTLYRMIAGGGLFVAFSVSSKFPMLGTDVICQNGLSRTTPVCPQQIGFDLGRRLLGGPAWPSRRSFDPRRSQCRARILAGSRTAIGSRIPGC